MVTAMTASLVRVERPWEELRPRAGLLCEQFSHPAPETSFASGLSVPYLSGSRSANSPGLWPFGEDPSGTASAETSPILKDDLVASLFRRPNSRRYLRIPITSSASSDAISVIGRGASEGLLSEVEPDIRLWVEVSVVEFPRVLKGLVRRGLSAKCAFLETGDPKAVIEAPPRRLFKPGLWGYSIVLLVAVVTSAVSGYRAGVGCVVDETPSLMSEEDCRNDAFGEIPPEAEEELSSCEAIGARLLMPLRPIRCP